MLRKKTSNLSKGKLEMTHWLLTGMAGPRASHGVIRTYPLHLRIHLFLCYIHLKQALST